MSLSLLDKDSAKDISPFIASSVSLLIFESFPALWGSFVSAIAASSSSASTLMNVLSKSKMKYFSLL
jgi:hypothetical protein